MKNQILIIVIFLGGILVSCGSSNRGNADSPEYTQMLERVQDLDFEIENDWANPVKYSRVNLLGNPNYIRFEGDSVNVFLPFFGERHSGGYGSEGALQYEGLIQNLRIEENPGRNQVIVLFEGENKSENLDFRIAIFPNGSTNTSVNSSERDQISYDGNIKEE